MFQGFYPETFQFFFQIGMHNDKSWFDVHRGEYEKYVVVPALELITALDPLLRTLSPHYSGVAKRLGGSLMRIHRDVRFSKDKTPYKTNLGIQFRHSKARDVHAPGWYVHLDPGECFVGAGTWRPEPGDLKVIRASLQDRPGEWEAAIRAGTLGTGLSPAGESLKRVPKGFDPAHPLADHIRRKDFLLSQDLDPGLFLKPELVDVLMDKFRHSVPYMAQLCRALGAEF